MKKSFKALYKMRYLLLLLVPLLVVMVAISTMGMKVPSARDKTPEMGVLYGPTVSLGTTASFAILAATGITDTGPSTVIGDIGSYPTNSITAGILLTGTNHGNDAVAQGAQTDLVTAYNDANSRTPLNLGNTQLGGLTLNSGVYSTGGVLQIGPANAVLTLDAQGDPNAVFIFQSTATLVTFESTRVNLINGARFCRVFWVVPTAATLGANSYFVGHIFAYTEKIALGSGATVEGQLMTRVAEVTLIDNTITNGPCDTIAYSGGILTIYKVDSSGKPIVAYSPALAASFNIYYNAADIGVKPPVQTGSIIKDTNFFRTNLQNGIYYVVETSAPEGYSIDSTVRTVTISGGDAAVTFVNTTGASGAATTTTAVEVAAEKEESTPVVTATTAVPVTTTVTGGKLPKTGTPWYNLLLAGIILILIGAIVWISRKVYAKRSKT